MQQLANPRGISESEAEALIEQLPAIVWLSYGVHGNEISSADAALLLAYYLLADGDTTFDSIRDNVLVIIDPAQNPDGRADSFSIINSMRGLNLRRVRLPPSDVRLGRADAQIITFSI